MFLVYLKVVDIISAILGIWCEPVIKVDSIRDPLFNYFLRHLFFLAISDILNIEFFWFT